MTNYGNDVNCYDLRFFFVRAEDSVQKMIESNTQIRLLDGELQDELLRETVEETLLLTLRQTDRHEINPGLLLG